MRRGSLQLAASTWCSGPREPPSPVCATGEAQGADGSLPQGPLQDLVLLSCAERGRGDTPSLRVPSLWGHTYSMARARLRCGMGVSSGFGGRLAAGHLQALPG